MFYIKSLNEFWTGNSWTTRQEVAKEYEFDEGLDVIKRRFSRGIRKVKRGGEMYFEPVPLLVRGNCRERTET